MGPFLVGLRSKASKWGCGTPESLKAHARLFFCSRNSAHTQVAVSLLDLENGDSKDRKNGCPQILNAFKLEPLICSTLRDCMC